jgi:hypothetical protein
MAFLFDNVRDRQQQPAENRFFVLKKKSGGDMIALVSAILMKEITEKKSGAFACLFNFFSC